MNLMKGTASLFAAIALASTVVFAQGRSPITPTSPVQAKLTIPDSKLLPGVPFDLWIEVRNPSDTSVGVGLCADMLVTTDGKESFTISLGGETAPAYPTLLPEHDWNGAAVKYLVLKPRETTTLTLPILPDLQGPIYFADDRVSQPGRYAISLRLDYCWGIVTPQKALLPPDFLGAITTNEVTVERIEPTGSDAAVWKRMQALANGKWVPINWTGTEAGRTVIGEIIGTYSDSNYYPYALLAASFGAVDERAHSRFLDAIKRFPKSPVAELLELSAWGTSVTAHKGAKSYDEHYAKVKAFKRPTTRIRAFGREDVPPPPCEPQDDCTD